MYVGDQVGMAARSNIQHRAQLYSWLEYESLHVDGWLGVVGMVAK